MDSFSRLKKISLDLWLAPVLVLVFASVLAMMYGWVGTVKSIGTETRERPEVARWVAAQGPVMGPGQQAHHLPAPVSVGLGNGPNSQLQLINTPQMGLGIGNGPNSQLQLINRITNVYLGLRLKALDPGPALRMGFGDLGALLVLDVAPNAPAAQEGLQAGDGIVSVDRQNVQSLDQLATALAFKKPGDVVKVVYYRDGQKKSAHLKLTAIPSVLPAAANVIPPWIGADIQNIDVVMKNQFNLPDRRGVVISNIIQGAPAGAAGLQIGDVVTSFNGENIDDVQQFRAVFGKCQAGQEVVLGVRRQGLVQDVAMVLGQQGGANTLPLAVVPPAEMVVEGSWIGMDVSELKAKDAVELGFAAGSRGILVNDVESPPAITVGFQTGDLITVINGTPTPNMKQFVEATKMQSGAVVDVLRGNRHLFITVPPPGLSQQGTAIDPGPQAFKQVAMVRPQAGRLAIFAAGPDLTDAVAGESLPAPYLILTDLGQSSFMALKVNNLTELDETLRKHQVVALVGTDVSSKNAALYSAAGISVYGGVVGPVSEAIRLYRAGSLLAMK